MSTSSPWYQRREVSTEQFAAECDYMAEFGMRCGHAGDIHDEAGQCEGCINEYNEGRRLFEAICDNGPMFSIPLVSEPPVQHQGEQQ